MAAKIIDGKALADELRQQVKQRVEELLRIHRREVYLSAILIGGTPAGELYAQRQKEACQAVGIRYELIHLPAEASQEMVARRIHQLNHDNSVTGIMLHLPLPRGLDATALQYQIDPVKDVEGVNPANIGYVVYGQTVIAPCTAMAVLNLIQSTGVPIRGAEAVIVGASEIAGKPIALLLSEQMATITLCHIATKDLKQHTTRADILVVAVGKPCLITANHVREGAIVIDVGINRVPLPGGGRKTIGDVDFTPVSEKAGYITPVPGGVGPMTVAMLMKNTLRSAELLMKSKSAPASKGTLT